MKKINEDVNILDPKLAQQFANGKTQQVNNQQKINALEKQIMGINQQNNQIQQKMVQIEQKAASEQGQENSQESGQPQETVEVPVAQNAQQSTSESLLVRESFDGEMDAEYEALSDELITLRNIPNDKRTMVQSKLMQSIQHRIYDLESKFEVEQMHNQRNEYKSEYSNDEWSIDENGGNPLATENFYNLTEAYVDDEITFEANPPEEYAEEKYLIYVRITDGHNEFIGKIFKLSPDGEWYGIVKDGADSKHFENMTYDANYYEAQILDYLLEIYDEVEVINIDEFNNYIEGDIEELEVKDID